MGSESGVPETRGRQAWAESTRGAPNWGHFGGQVEGSFSYSGGSHALSWGFCRDRRPFSGPATAKEYLNRDTYLHVRRLVNHSLNGCMVDPVPCQ
jgi:hypothetical protein